LNAIQALSQLSYSPVDPLLCFLYDSLVKCFCYPLMLSVKPRISLGSVIRRR